MLTTNSCYKFRSLTKNEFVGILAFQDINNDIIIKLKAQMGHSNFRPETKVNFVNTNELNISSNIEVPSIGALNFQREHFTNLYNTYLVDTLCT